MLFDVALDGRPVHTGERVLLDDAVSRERQSEELQHVRMLCVQRMCAPPIYLGGLMSALHVGGVASRCRSGLRV